MPTDIMQADTEILRRLYHLFNTRAVAAVLPLLSQDVAWANAMEGGHVHGRDAVAAYWARQWAIVSPHVTPLRFTPGPDGSIVAEVTQVISDLAGNPLPGQAQGLASKTVRHVFRLRHGQVTHFDVRDSP